MALPLVPAGLAATTGLGRYRRWCSAVAVGTAVGSSGCSVLRLLLRQDSGKSTGSTETRHDSDMGSSRLGLDCHGTFVWLGSRRRGLDRGFGLHDRCSATKGRLRGDSRSVDRRRRARTVCRGGRRRCTLDGRSRGSFRFRRSLWDQFEVVRGRPALYAVLLDQPPA